MKALIRIWLLLYVSVVEAFMPVVLFHGVLSGSESMASLKRYIEIRHPGTKVYNCDLYSNWNSLEAAWKQVVEYRDYLNIISKKHPEGIIVLGDIQEIQTATCLNFYHRIFARRFVSKSSNPVNA
uniref:Calcineurin-like phosphoesterase domain-containing protein n=1 Tax=Musca domestica TaxID=7370 RepID=A0A1I8MRZ5_MUSDO